MRKTLIALVLLTVAGVAAGGYWMLREPEPEWTSASPRALAELQRGLEALSKVYHADAREHFARAVELDSDLVIAKLYLAKLGDQTEAEVESLRSEIAAADRSGLNPQERFLIEYWLAVTAESPERAPEEILDAFLARYPDNFHGLRHRCAAYWMAQDWEPAEACYQRLIELHPNWVVAQNALGYIAMARGRFSEAEERFSTYRYVAPDQANPHDSMAELLITLGRYEEAEASLKRAIAAKPDFCHAYQLRAQIGLFSGRLEIVDRALRDLAGFEACEYLEEYGYSCLMAASARYFAGDAEGAWEAIDGDCLERQQGVDLIAHRIAVMTGHADRALEMEARLRQRRDQAAADGRPDDADFHAACLAHSEGLRALVAGDTAGAVELLTKTDELLGYWGGERAAFKLFHRMNLLYALELAGEKTAAETLRRKIGAVNPRILEDVRLLDLEELAAG